MFETELEEAEKDRYELQNRINELEEENKNLKEQLDNFLVPF
jgi:septal ring factor EnvC (AmiA/AmiB activator)